MVCRGLDSTILGKEMWDFYLSKEDQMFASGKIEKHG